MLSRSLILALFAMATPATAQLSQASQVDEGDQLARLQAEFAQNPQNADVLRRLAQAQAAEDDLVAAQRSIDRAYAIAPDDLDIQMARAYVLLWRGEIAAAAAQAQKVSARDPNYPELSQLEGAIALRRSANIDAPAQSALGGGTAYVNGGLSWIDRFGGSSDQWKTATIGYYKRLRPGTSLGGAVEYERRNVTDVRLTARLDQTFDRGSYYIGISGTPDADFREELGISGGGSLRLAPRLEALADARLARYPTATVAGFQTGLRYFPTDRLSFTVRAIELLDDKLRIGGSLRGDLIVGRDNSLFATAALYPDTENSITRQVRAFAIGARVPVSDKIALRISGEDEKRDDSYHRQGVSLGLSLRFGNR